MIANQIIDLFFGLITTLWDFLASYIPQIAIADKMIEYTLKILEICTQGANFVKFMIGDLAIPIIEITILLLIYKYTLFPIVQFIRSIFVNSN